MMTRTSKKFRVWLKAEGEESAQTIERCYPEFAAEAFAQRLWQGDAWDPTCPLEVVVDGVEYAVRVDTDPTFHAREVR